MSINPGFTLASSAHGTKGHEFQHIINRSAYRVRERADIGDCVAPRPTEFYATAMFHCSTFVREWKQSQGDGKGADG
jgi:hypothetical protein